MTFNVRSLFAFSSINASLVQQSDKSRVTVVELKPDKRKHGLEELVAAEADTLTEEYISRFYARCIALAPVIRRNSTVFAKAVAVVMGEQRAGDQIGTLLAGAYSLTSDAEITYEQAANWVAELDLAEYKVEIETMSDERACLDQILESKLEIDLGGKREARTIAEWITMARENQILLALQREGFHVLSSGNEVGRGVQIVVLNQMSGIKRLLRGSPWEGSDYNKVMKRLPGAKPLENSISIAALRTNKRGLRINLDFARK